VFSSFARFLEEHKYTTTMWETGYSAAQSNEICAALTQWGQSAMSLNGEFLMLWSEQVETKFRGDSELVYAVDGLAYLLPNPFLEGDSEGFLGALVHLVQGNQDDLYSTPIRSRILFNAV